MSNVLYKCNIGQNGRILLPAKLRKRFNLNIGDQIILTEENNTLAIRSLNTNIQYVQDFIKSHNVNKMSLVDSLLEDRKNDE